MTGELTIPNGQPETEKPATGPLEGIPPRVSLQEAFATREEPVTEKEMEILGLHQTCLMLVHHHPNEKPGFYMLQRDKSGYHPVEQANVETTYTVEPAEFGQTGNIPEITVTKTHEVDGQIREEKRTRTLEKVPTDGHLARKTGEFWISTTPDTKTTFGIAVFPDTKSMLDFASENTDNIVSYGTIASDRSQ
ncbi:hypothetical protein JW710_00480 [Candidatus Dojkabacteria bacterium]|nr:hypothetical protein [Candidatus Dojkabacteria bacterium]